MLAAFDTKLKRIHAVTDKIPAKKVIMAYSCLLYTSADLICCFWQYGRVGGASRHAEGN